MISQTLFNNNDTARLQTSCKRFQLIGYLCLFALALIESGVAYIVSSKQKIVFWPVVLASLLFLLFAFYMVFFKRINLFRKDLSERIKLVTKFQVTSKSETDKQLLIGFNSEDLRQIALNRASFDKISIGDNLDVEFAKYSKFLFRLSKDGELIINGG